MVHPSVRKAVNGRYQQDISNVFLELKGKCRDAGFVTQLKQRYERLNPAKFEKKDFREILSVIQVLLGKEEIKVLVMNGNSNISSDEYVSGSNVIIGGNTLGRGDTFAGLQIIYYTRTSKNFRQIRCGSTAVCLAMIGIRGS